MIYAPVCITIIFNYIYIKVTITVTTLLYLTIMNYDDLRAAPYSLLLS